MFSDGIFESRSEGVASFWVNDYTEVDFNVTRHLNRELSFESIRNNDWDILILHYLGLDHIGHSLGGEHPQIEIKLKEMDLIIFDITQKLRKVTKDFVILVTGDHGMTLLGGHGGNSLQETRVPLIVIGGNSNSLNEMKEVLPGKIFCFLKINKKNLEGEIEQVDLYPLIISLLDLEHVSRLSLGVLSFLSKIEKDWRKTAQDLRANIHHFMDFLSATQRGSVEHLVLLGKLLILNF